MKNQQRLDKRRAITNREKKRKREIIKNRGNQNGKKWNVKTTWQFTTRGRNGALEEDNKNVKAASLSFRSKNTGSMPTEE